MYYRYLPAICTTVVRGALYRGYCTIMRLLYVIRTAHCTNRGYSQYIRIECSTYIIIRQEGNNILKASLILICTREAGYKWINIYRRSFRMTLFRRDDKITRLQSRTRPTRRYEPQLQRSEWRVFYFYKTEKRTFVLCLNGWKKANQNTLITHFA